MITPYLKSAGRIKKEKKKKKVNYKEKLWKIFSQYIRLRDADDRGYVRCISSGKVMFWADCDAGHYIAKNAGLFFYFNEENVYAQSPYDNRYLHGNLLGYRRGLINRGLEDIADKLEYQGAIGEIRDKLNASCKYSDEDYINLIRVYKDKLSELKKNKSYIRQ